MLWCFGIEIERLYRITRTPQSEVGETLWTLPLLASCQHLAQLYGELKRRCKARRARELLQQAPARQRRYEPQVERLALLSPAHRML